MEQFTLEIDKAPAFRFTGELLAAESSSQNNASNYYSGETGRWAELALYKTRAGKYVCHQIGRTCWAGEHDRYSGKVCDTLDEVREFFGHGWLAKALYASAQIDDYTSID